MKTKKFSEIKYSRPDLSQYYILKQAKIEAFQRATSADIQIEIFREIIALDRDYPGWGDYAYIKYSQDVSDKFFEEEVNFFDAENPKIAALSKKFVDIALKSKFLPELEKTFGKQFFDLAKLQSKVISEQIIDLIQQENKLSTQYQKLKSEIRVEFEGKTYNLSGMSPLLEHTDRAIRKSASRANYKSLREAQPQFDQIYDELVKLRHEMAQKLGYENFVQMGYDRMGRTDYTYREIEQYRNFVKKHIVPKVTQIRSSIADKLGLDKLYHYDTLLFADGNPTPKTSPEQMIQDALTMYQELSPETGRFFQEMIDSECLDLVNRDNKSPGGYCSYEPSIRMPFIFSNFNGTSHDVDVLTHEAGHAFQAYCSRDFEVKEYLFPTSEAAEIHSMSMEFFAYPWVNKFFQEDTKKYYIAHAYSGFSFLCYGCCVDEFQQRVYENPSLTPLERRALWTELQAEYQPFLNIDDEPFLSEGGRWQNQAHIYQMPFYYIDYTLAQVCAFQFYRKMSQNFESAWQDYHNLCQRGGSLNFSELIQIANLKSPFEEEVFIDVSSFIFSEIMKKLDDFYQAKSA